jgi:hypothetical protein
MKNLNFALAQPMNLKMFDATNNSNQPVARYEKEYKGVFQAAFAAVAPFAQIVDSVQIVDGVKNNDIAFYVKVNNDPVTINDYNKGANVAMGTGTGTGSRFGNAKEIKFSDVPVPYSFEKAINEGIDIHTVNNGEADAVAQRSKVQAEAILDFYGTAVGAHISAIATKTETFNLTTGDVADLFNKMHTHFVNKKAVGQPVAYLTADLYAKVVDHPLVNNAKGATVDIGGQTVPKFKGFAIFEEPVERFEDGDIAYFSVQKSVIPFLGIETARTIGAEGFDGKLLQLSFKGGTFTTDDMKKLVAKAVTPS